MKLYTIACAPGYPSGGTDAFEAKRQRLMGVNRIQRAWLVADTHVATVITDVPDPRSALSLVRRT